MEGGEDAVATASGMGAVGAVMIAVLKCGDHVIFDNSVYGGTNAVAPVNLPNFGIEVSRADTSDLEALMAAFKPNTKMIYFETPNTPMIKVTDVAAVKAVAGKDIRVVVETIGGVDAAYTYTRRALEAVTRASESLEAGITPDALLTDAEEALAALGELTGASVREDVTARIFERFCVGK